VWCESSKPGRTLHLYFASFTLAELFGAVTNKVNDAYLVALQGYVTMWFRISQNEMISSHLYEGYAVAARKCIFDLLWVKCGRTSTKLWFVRPHVDVLLW
jgi:hypothetical protein